MRTDPQARAVETGLTELEGSELLDEVRAVIRRYCVLPGEHELVAVTLWCALTHLSAEFDYAPRLVIRSAEKRSGKSRLLEVVDGLVYSPLRVVNGTVAYVFRSLDRDPPPTLLFDEADTIFGSKRVAEKNEDLRGLLNAGFQRGLRFGRVVGSDLATREFETFAMAALAGIGKMPETIEDRAVVIVMKRRHEGEIVQPFRIGRDGKTLDELRDRIAEWADTVREVAGTRGVDLPVDDRAADVWEPLIAVADLAGGQWQQLARDAAVALTSAAAEDDTARSPQLQLLADIRQVFNASFMGSGELCAKLRALPESPWDQIELNAPKLGIRLREYSIRTRHSPDKAVRGYHLSDFTDAFSRYLPGETASETVQPVPDSAAFNALADNAFDGCAPSVTANVHPRTVKEKRSVNNLNPVLVPDTMDTVGRVSEVRGTQPSPAEMPKRRDEATRRTTERPKRQRLRTRGRHSARSRGETSV